MTKLIVLIGVLVSSMALAQESCTSDFSGTFRTGQPELPLSQLCFDCREINEFPEDIRNFMYNWAILDEAGDSTGHLVYELRENERLLTSPVARISTPVCNPLGQCSTGSISITFNTTVLLRRGITLYLNLGVRQFDVHVSNANGDVTTARYFPDQAELSLPANSQTDPFADECLNNYQEERPPDSEMEVRDRSFGGGDLYNGQARQHWESEASWWPYIQFSWICGTSTVEGGGSTTTCGWFK